MSAAGVVVIGVVVIGVGNPDRGDDAVGPEVVRRIARCEMPHLAVRVGVDPLDLVHLWDGFRHAVVVDAMMSGREPGSVTVQRVGVRSGTSTSGERQGPGTHSFGVLGAVELARALGRLPDEVTLVGVEAATMAFGSGMSPEVAAAVPAVVQLVVDLVDERVPAVQADGGV